MKRFTRILSMCLCLLLCISISPAALASTNYTIDIPYEYPVTPTSSEWLKMSSHAERVNSCQIPATYLSSMSTSALIQTIASYPLLVDLLLFNNSTEAYQAIQNFNAISELEKRPDALSELARFIETDESIQADYISKTALEVIALSANFQTETSSDRSTLHSSQLNYSDAYNLYPDLSPSTAEGTLFRAATPVTPSGNPITVTWYYDRTPELTSAQISAIEAEVIATYGLYPADDATVKYNCHSYAWHSQSKSNKYWINYPDDYLNDPLVRKVSSPSVGDRIVYQKTSSGSYLHSGVVTTANSNVTMITSKWGAWGLYHHTVNNCPSDYGSYISYYTVD